MLLHDLAAKLAFSKYFWQDSSAKNHLQVTFAGDLACILSSAAVILYLSVGRRLRQYMPLFVYACPVTGAVTRQSLDLASHLGYDLYHQQLQVAFPSSCISALMLIQEGTFTPESLCNTAIASRRLCCWHSQSCCCRHWWRIRCGSRESRSSWLDPVKVFDRRTVPCNCSWCSRTHQPECTPQVYSPFGDCTFAHVGASDGVFYRLGHWADQCTIPTDIHRWICAPRCNTACHIRKSQARERIGLGCAIFSVLSGQLLFSYAHDGRIM